MSEDKIHVYVDREVLFKNSLTVSIKIIVPDSSSPTFIGELLEETIDKVQRWEPRKEWD